MNGVRPPTCPRCKLDVDKPGHCINCKRFLQAGKSGPVSHLLCCVCGIAFPEGKPHTKCLDKYERRAAAGLPMPAVHWARRSWARKARDGKVFA